MTSPLLINDEPLQMLPSLAVVLNGRSNKGGNRNGDRKALFLQQLHYWLRKAEQSKGHLGRFKDGRWWIYNSKSEWLENNFPMWSEDTLERIIDCLIKMGIVLLDREGEGKAIVSWYSIDYDCLNSLLANGGTVPPKEPYWGHNAPNAPHSAPNTREPENTTEITRTESSNASAAGASGAAALPLQQKQRRKHPRSDEVQKSEDEGSKVVPKTDMGKWLVAAIGATFLTERQERVLESEVELVGDDGRKFSVVPAELFETDELYRRWCDIQITDLKNRRKGSVKKVSREQAILTRTTGGKYVVQQGTDAEREYAIHTSLLEFYQWRKGQVIRDAMPTARVDPAYKERPTRRVEMD